MPLIFEWFGHLNLETTVIYAYADTEMKRLALEKATSASHSLSNTEVFNGSKLDDYTLKRLYGLI